jgi:cobalt/nickel transport system permease protein
MSHVLGGAAGAVSALDGRPFSSAIGRIDPRARVVAAVIFAVTVVALQDFLALAAGLVLSLAVMAAARMPAGRTLRRMAAMDGFIIFMLVMLPFTMPGETLFSLFGFPASREGFLQALRIGLKANAIVLMLMALVGSMESTTLCHALYRLRAPANLVHLLMFTVRYIDVLHQEYQRLRTAMTARGFRPANSRHTYRSYGYLVGMMLVRALERSERVFGAMKCRGFTGRFHVVDSMSLTPADAWFAVIAAASVAGLILMEYAHAVPY